MWWSSWSGVGVPRMDTVTATYGARGRGASPDADESRRPTVTLVSAVQRALRDQRERAARDQARDVDAEDGHGAGRLPGLPDAGGDADVGGGRDRRDGDRDADGRARAGLQGEHRRDPGDERHQERRAVDGREPGEDA